MNRPRRLSATAAVAAAGLVALVAFTAGGCRAPGTAGAAGAPGAGPAAAALPRPARPLADTPARRLDAPVAVRLAPAARRRIVETSAASRPLPPGHRPLPDAEALLAAAFSRSPWALEAGVELDESPIAGRTPDGGSVVEGRTCTLTLTVPDPAAPGDPGRVLLRERGAGEVTFVQRIRDADTSAGRARRAAVGPDLARVAFARALDDLRRRLDARTDELVELARRHNPMFLEFEAVPPRPAADPTVTR